MGTDSLYDYAGVLHLHSKYSHDGSVAPEEIIAEAKKHALDFIVITDHGNLEAKKDGYEGWNGGLLTLVGEEISPAKNHYLALGITEPVLKRRAHDAPQGYIDDVTAAGGTGLIAHPDHTGTARFGVPSYSWDDWSVHGYAGMSIWDLMTDYQENLASLPKALAATLFPAFFLKGPKKETLRRWDALNRTGRVAGYGEVDNHDFVRSYAGARFHIFPFSYALSTITTHVLVAEKLSKEGTHAQQQILGALKRCSAYVSQERWRKAAGFRFTMNAHDGETGIGGTVTLAGRPAQAAVTLPETGRITLVADGAAVAVQDGKSLSFTVRDPGVYRVEAQQKVCGFYKPWIYSNPIWVR